MIDKNKHKKTQRIELNKISFIVPQKGNSSVKAAKRHKIQTCKRTQM